MVVIFVRTLITYLTLIIVIRLMGKRQIGEMQPFEFIVTLIIADIACIPMADVSIPLWYGIAGVISLFIIHQLLSIFEHFGSGIKKVISGKPSLVINTDGVDIKELKKNNIDIEDLLESLRTSGYFSFDDVSYAIFESNGKFSAFPKDDTENKGTSLPLVLINDGKIINRNLKLLHLQSEEIIKFLSCQQSKIKNTEVMTIDGNGRVYFKQKNKPFNILQYNLSEDVKW